MRLLVAMPALASLLLGCNSQDKPYATLKCRVAEPPSLSVSFGLGTRGGEGETRRVDYGDGQTSDSKVGPEAMLHTYRQPGQYTVRVTVEGPDGTAADECSVTVPQR